jgi:hypothetical protein
MYVYRPQPAETQSIRYVQGVGTMTAREPDHELYMYARYKMQGPSYPTFTIGYANNSAAPVNFSTDNVKAYFRGAPVPIYTYAERIEEINTEKTGKKVGLAILGGLAAGAAAYGASHQTYRSNYSGVVSSGRHFTTFSGSSTLRVYDPMSGILAGAAVGGATALGFRQLDLDAANQELAANSILQENTVDPQRVVSGELILRNCCDLHVRSEDTIRFEISVNSKVHVFEFSRVPPGSPMPASRTATSVTTASAAPSAGVMVVPPVSSSVVETSAAKATPPAPAPVAPVPTPAPPAAAADRAAPKPAPVYAGGQESFSVERLARNGGCSADPKVQLTAKGPGFEAYSVACTNGDAIQVRCDMGQCRVLR